MSVPAEVVAGTDLADSRGMEDAASFVVSLLDRPSSEVRVVEGQLGLLDDVVFEGHPDGFELTPLSPADPGIVWAVDGGSTVLADGRSFQVAATRAARVRFSAGATDLVEAPPLSVQAVSQDEMRGLYRGTLERMRCEIPDDVPEGLRPVDFLRECAEWQETRRTVAEAAPGDLVLVDGSL
ncbi:MAG TPA: hypothetical protein VHH92_07015, partial [Actinomycetota bacterium]|nr:hypothetical protein [Actinomycetota bacterium]